jgi:hypothetical protein
MCFGKTSLRQTPRGCWRAASVLASLFTAALTLPVASPAGANILVTIDKSAQQMSVAVDGAPRYVWPVSTGRPGYDTPNGTFKPNRMDADHYSQEWDNAPMPHTIFFDLNGHAIHGSSGQSYYAQRGYAQPGYAQPGYAQPGYAQPGYAQPAYPPQPPPAYWQR